MPSVFLKLFKRIKKKLKSSEFSSQSLTGGNTNIGWKTLGVQKIRAHQSQTGGKLAHYVRSTRIFLDQTKVRFWLLVILVNVVVFILFVVFVVLFARMLRRL